MKTIEWYAITNIIYTCIIFIVAIVYGIIKYKEQRNRNRKLPIQPPLGEFVEDFGEDERNYRRKLESVEIYIRGDEIEKFIVGVNCELIIENYDGSISITNEQKLIEYTGFCFIKEVKNDRN